MTVSKYEYEPQARVDVTYELWNINLKEVIIEVHYFCSDIHATCLLYTTTECQISVSAQIFLINVIAYSEVNFSGTLNRKRTRQNSVLCIVFYVCMHFFLVWCCLPVVLLEPYKTIDSLEVAGKLLLRFKSTTPAVNLSRTYTSLVKQQIAPPILYNYTSSLRPAWWMTYSFECVCFAKGTRQKIRLSIYVLFTYFEMTPKGIYFYKYTLTVLFEFSNMHLRYQI